MECAVVGCAGSADLKAVHNLPLSAFSLVLSFSLTFSIVIYRNSDRSVATPFGFLNLTLVFLSHEPLCFPVTVVPT